MQLVSPFRFWCALASGPGEICAGAPIASESIKRRTTRTLVGRDESLPSGATTVDCISHLLIDLILLAFVEMNGKALQRESRPGHALPEKDGEWASPKPTDDAVIDSLRAVKRACFSWSMPVGARRWLVSFPRPGYFRVRSG